MATQHPKHEAYDDLTTIKGIGRSRQQWLREQLDVQTYNDMAALSAEDVYGKLKDDGQIISLTDIESWIEQARQMETAVSSTPTLKVKSKNWQPFGSFVVEFQQNIRTGERRTSAHHVEADRSEIWAGVEQRNLCQWMTKHLGDQQPDQQTANAAAPITESQVEQADAATAHAVPQSVRPPENVSPVIPSTSDRIQQILAKANALKEASPKPASNSPVVTRTTEAKTSAPESKLTAGFSPALQNALKKAQGLLSGK